ncbi:MAG: hypothetical protein ABIJ97_10200 [Bacteroidota bacterium]
MKLGIYTIFIFCLVSTCLFTQEIEPDRKNIKPVNSGYYTLPMYSDSGILLCDSKFEFLYLFNETEDSAKIIFKNKADLKRLILSSDRKFIGILMIDDNGLICPASLSIHSGQIQKLFKPVGKCSDVSFSDNFKIAFAVENVIFIIENDDTSKLQFDFIIQSVRLAPDGVSFAIIDEKNFLRIFDLNKNFVDVCSERIDNIDSWSPDGNKLLYIKETDYFVYDKVNQVNYNLGNIASPDWKEDSNYIIYHKNNPYKMKFVNSDIFICDYKGEEIFQITNTFNTYEMQPVFGNEDQIFYMTYENRQLIKAKYNIKKKKLSDQIVLLEIK